MTVPVFHLRVHYAFHTYQQVVTFTTVYPLTGHKKRNVYFNISKYAMTNEIVQKALSSQFTDGKMQKWKNVTSCCTMNVPLCLHVFHYCNMVWIYSVAPLGTCVHV